MMTYKYENLVVSYGSNTDLYDLDIYAKRNGFPENRFNFESVVRVPDYKLAFDTYSKNRGGGVLNIQPSIGHAIEACLFSTDRIGLEILRKKEAVPYKYEEKPIIVIDKDGNEISAITYIVKPELRGPIALQVKNTFKFVQLVINSIILTVIIYFWRQRMNRFLCRSFCIRYFDERRGKVSCDPTNRSELCFDCCLSWYLVNKWKFPSSKSWE